MATWSNLSLQDSASPLMEQLSFFHDHTMIVLLLITTIVSYSLSYMLLTNYTNRNMLNEHLIETIWTALPAVTLIFIAMPSLRLLYLLDDSSNALMTIKTIGRQWYWSYEYSDFINLEFDTYMTPEKDLEMNEFRLLDVDNRTILPMNTEIRVLTSASDVLHSWTIPALGIKIDATPGRLNQGMFLINRPGLFFGQCSEICGANHSFMPIVIESTSVKLFIKWLSNMI
uniref:Cytochrome c oxidase subunit 2 n=3 Tax=Oedipodinae TaxID=27549 RepID=A0A0U1V9V2_9ORTH|nr:cytochrome c oxidase subunit II [Angaracris rhodopa]YP_009740630.1 cytochrome c oxidase subunit II [Bryodemella holdereri holdereri]YP_009740721.1 cytochrome c oxidase subunit II [Bryodema dolichoptera]AIY61454.1 cytochrome c oxidase subunit II [Angaracris rhodopa]QID03592.1 cytochrome c oxidase subunit II [Bryodemella holdereri holdereri]QID03696.1 cytochrome c oxidase subunit II [Bryodema dolichoptera]